MADIPGSSGNDSLVGSADGDTITSGGGQDTIDAAAGDDFIILNGRLLPSVIDGGSGLDTLVLRFAENTLPPNLPVPPPYPTTLYQPNLSTVSSIEKVVFESAQGTAISVVFSYGSATAPPQLAANTQLVGGAGYDTLTMSAFMADGTVTAPTFVYTDWQSPDRAYLPGDSTGIWADFNNSNLTINGSAHTGKQVLNDGPGNDTINGSDDMDYISAQLGFNEVHGNGGDDTLYTSEGAWATSFDGGDGFDFLGLGGIFEFNGTVRNVEGLWLSSGLVSIIRGGLTQLVTDTEVTIGSDILAGLPANLEIDGAGTLIVPLAEAEDADAQFAAADPAAPLAAGPGFDGSQYVFTPGAQIAIGILGSDRAEAIIGTSVGDSIYGGGGNDTLTGGGGSDWFAASLGNDVVTDFVHGEDRIDLREIGVTTLIQAMPYMKQSGSDVLFSLTYDGALNTLRVQDVQLASLTSADFVFASNEPRGVAGTDNADVLFGGASDDMINAGGGNDTIFGAGGSDTVYLSGLISDYAITRDGAGVRVTDLREPFLFNTGSDLLFGIARLVFQNAAPLALQPSEFRFVGPDGWSGTVGNYGQVFGSNGFQHILVEDRSSFLTFDGSFARGGDAIQLSRPASAFDISTSGSSAILTDGDTTLSIPIGTSGLALSFSDGIRTLGADGILGPNIGGQAITSSPTQVNAAPDGTVLPAGAMPGVDSRLTLLPGGTLRVDGDAEVFGTASFEQVTVLGGTVTLEGSFARGGDGLFLALAPETLTVRLSGSNAMFESGDDSVIVPVGSTGMIVVVDGVDLNLRFDTGTNEVMLGAQAIGSTATILSAQNFG